MFTDDELDFANLRVMLHRESLNLENPHNPKLASEVKQGRRQMLDPSWERTDLGDNRSEQSTEHRNQKCGLRTGE